MWFFERRGTISHRSLFIGTILAVNILKQKKQKNKNYFKMFTLPGEHDVDVKYQVPHPPLSSLLSPLSSLLWFSVVCKIKKFFLEYSQRFIIFIKDTLFLLVHKFHTMFCYLPGALSSKRICGPLSFTWHNCNLLQFILGWRIRSCLLCNVAVRPGQIDDGITFKCIN